MRHLAAKGRHLSFAGGAHGGTAYAAVSDPRFSLDVNGDGVVDAGDLELFTDLWNQQQAPRDKPPARRR